MNKILAVLDSDVVYASRLIEYFKKRNEFHFELSIFTKLERLEEFLKQHQIEILLLGEDTPAQSLLLDRVKYIYSLAEDIKESGSVGFKQIFKYQSAQNVIDEIQSDYKKKILENVHGSSSEHTNLITIFTLQPDYEKAAFAWSYSLQMATRKKVLFIPFTLFSVPILSPIDLSVQSVSEFIYYLKSNNPDLMKKMNELSGFVGNVSYLTGITHGFDLLSLNKDDMERWITQLRAAPEYHTIVFYLTFYSEAGMELVGKSDHVFALLSEDAYEQAQWRECQRQMDLLGTSTDHLAYHSLSLPQEDRIQGPGVTLAQLQNSAIWEFASQSIDIDQEAVISDA